MEILGLAFVIVIIVFGFLLYIRLSAFKDDGGIRERETYTALSSNILDSMLKSTYYCLEDGYSYQLKEIIKQYAFSTDYDDISCGDLGEEQILSFVINELLAETMDKYGNAYSFNIHKEGNTDMIYSYFGPELESGDRDESCVKGRYAPSIQIIPYRGVNVVVSFRICGPSEG